MTECNTCNMVKNAAKDGEVEKISQLVKDAFRKMGDELVKARREMDKKPPEYEEIMKILDDMLKTIKCEACICDLEMIKAYTNVARRATKCGDKDEDELINWMKKKTDKVIKDCFYHF